MKNKQTHVWTCDNEMDYFPSRPVISSLPSGFYFTKYSSDFGAYISKFEPKLDNNIEISKKIYSLVEKDFDKFWNISDKMKESGLEVRRSIMLHGQPSNGKKYIAKRIGEKFVKEYSGLVLYSEDPEDLKKIIKQIRLVEGSPRKIMVVIENLGIVLEKYGAQSVISLLKGVTNEQGIYIIATTNYEDRIADYVSDKPRMFNQKFLVGYPDKKERKEYISELISKMKESVSQTKINKIAKDTEGLSIGHIRTLVESHFLFEYNYKEILDELKTMKENIESSFYKIEENQNKSIGFG